jgi:drug/metabolite transporter (DMT)-like permease
MLRSFSFWLSPVFVLLAVLYIAMAGRKAIKREKIPTLYWIMILVYSGIPYGQLAVALERKWPGLSAVFLSLNIVWIILLSMVFWRLTMKHLREGLIAPKKQRERRSP